MAAAYCYAFKKGHQLLGKILRLVHRCAFCVNRLN